MKRGRVLVPPGIKPTVPQSQKSKGCLILTATLELSSNQITHFYSTAKNTAKMIRMAQVLIEKSQIAGSCICSGTLLHGTFQKN